MNRLFKSKKFKKNLALSTIVLIIPIIFLVSIFTKESIKITGSCTVEPAVVRIAELYKHHFNKTAYIVSGGSLAGITQAEQGNADIGLVSRALTAKEKIKLNYTTIGYDSMAVIVNKKNTINNITIKDLYDIYSGNTDNWKQFTGYKKEILITSHKTGSAAYDVFKHYTDIYNRDDNDTKSPKSLKMNYRAYVFANELDCIRFVSENPGAIGYMSLGTAKNMIDQNLSIKILSFNGVQPTFENINSGKYPIKRELNLVYKPENTKVKDFIDFSLTDQAQQIVKELNFIPVQK